MEFNMAFCIRNLGPRNAEIAAREKLIPPPIFLAQLVVNKASKGDIMFSFPLPTNTKM